MTISTSNLVAILLVTLACITDLRARRIPNVLTFGATIGALVFHLVVAGVGGLAESAGGWMLGAALFFPMFALRGMGAGDVKLLAAVGAWLGPWPVVCRCSHHGRRRRHHRHRRGPRVWLSPHGADEPVGAPDALARRRDPAAACDHARRRTRPTAGVCASHRNWNGDNAMAQITKTFRSRWASEDGAELIEFALVLPMLLLVVLGIAEFGFIFQRYEVLTNAAREGARIAVLPGYSTGRRAGARRRIRRCGPGAYGYG